MVKKIYHYIKNLFKEVIKVENVAKYIVYVLIALMIAAIFQYYIAPHPKIKVKYDDNYYMDNWDKVYIKNVGNFAAKDVEVRVLHNNICTLDIDVAESHYLNGSKSAEGIYTHKYYTTKWIIWDFDLNPGVELTLYCKEISKINIRVSGSNFKEVQKEYQIH
jgi:hypothetical protein